MYNTPYHKVYDRTTIQTSRGFQGFHAIVALSHNLPEGTPLYDTVSHQVSQRRDEPGEGLPDQRLAFTRRMGPHPKVTSESLHIPQQGIVLYATLTGFPPFFLLRR
jgi:hypothetical protein